MLHASRTVLCTETDYNEAICCEGCFEYVVFRIGSLLREAVIYGYSLGGVGSGDSRVGEWEDIHIKN